MAGQANGPIEIDANLQRGYFVPRLRELFIGGFGHGDQMQYTREILYIKDLVKKNADHDLHELGAALLYTVAGQLSVIKKLFDTPKILTLEDDPEYQIMINHLTHNMLTEKLQGNCLSYTFIPPYNVVSQLSV